MRRYFLAGFVAGLAVTMSTNAEAQSGLETVAAETESWSVLQEDQKKFADRMAASFFEDDLRLSQSRRIEAGTAEIYRALSSEERSEFREARRSEWRRFSEEQRRALRGVKRPVYENLAETQKDPFREAAMKRLGATASPAPAALNGADSQDI